MREDSAQFTQPDYVDRAERDMPRTLRQMRDRAAPSLHEAGYTLFRRFTNATFQGGRNYYLSYLSPDAVTLFEIAWSRTPAIWRLADLLMGQVRQAMASHRIIVSTETSYGNGDVAEVHDTDFGIPYPPYVHVEHVERAEGVPAMLARHGRLRERLEAGGRLVPVKIRDFAHHLELDQALRERLGGELRKASEEAARKLDPDGEG